MKEYLFLLSRKLKVGDWQISGTSIVKRKKMMTPMRLTNEKRILTTIKVFSTQKAMKRLWWVLGLSVIASHL